MSIQAPKGTKDILPSESYKWQYIERIIRDIANQFNYKQITTPVFEYTELFERGVGETTDIVQKEMYTFIDKAERSITLRPEGTAPSIRSFIEHNMDQELLPQKLYYMMPMYRYENVQKGRYREFVQFGMELIGSKESVADFEVISVIDKLFKELELSNIKLHINSIGCPECRKSYTVKLKEYLKDNYDELCETCKTRFDKNPLRILDCKEKRCKEIVKDAPIMLDYLCDECRAHFATLQALLAANGIEFLIDNNLVRGLDYYTKTVFEFISDNLGSQGTICAGGRYDGLAEICGGKPTPAVGFAMGIDRLLLEIEAQGIDIIDSNNADIYIGNLDAAENMIAQNLASELREEGFGVETNLMARSVKAQMKYASKINARYTCIIGQDEVASKTITLRDMKNSANIETDLNKESIKAILERGM